MVLTCAGRNDCCLHAADGVAAGGGAAAGGSASQHGPPAADERGGPGEGAADPGRPEEEIQRELMEEEHGASLC